VTKPRIVDRGDGPKIEGTRITVYTVLEYLRAGRTRDWIAAMLHLSSDQIQAAMDYIRDHDPPVNAEYATIVARIEKGNPAQVEDQLRANREKVKARLSRQQTSRSPLSMQRLLSARDVQGHVSRFMDICQRLPWVDLWCELECMLCTCEDFDLPVDATDATIWQACQDHDILMIPGNRNAAGPESWEMTIRQRKTPNCLPVLTLADPDRIQRERPYAEAVVERWFDSLIDPDALRGTGRLYLP